MDDTLVLPNNMNKKHYLGFCGSISNRGDFINDLYVKYKLVKDIDILGKNMVNAINSYYIHFNKNVSFDINFRTFETMACNTLLLTNYHQHHTDLGLKDGINFLTYKNRMELYEKLDYYLSDNKLSEIERISNAGFELTKLKHTYNKRIEKLLQFISNKI